MLISHVQGRSISCSEYRTGADRARGGAAAPLLGLAGPGDVSEMLDEEAAPSLWVNIDAVSLSDE